MSSIKIAAAATAAFLVTASMAQASPFEFRGFYAGAHFGYTDATADFDIGSDIDDEGTMGGLQAGYNHVFDNLLLGVEIDLTGNGASPSGTCPYNAGLDCKVDIGLMGTARLRAGYAVDDFLVYVTGGAAAARIDIDSSFNGGGG
jgi:outer membrane immunogenic protein